MSSRGFGRSRTADEGTMLVSSPARGHAAPCHLRTSPEPGLASGACPRAATSSHGRNPLQDAPAHTLGRSRCWTDTPNIPAAVFLFVCFLLFKLQSNSISHSSKAPRHGPGCGGQQYPDLAALVKKLFYPSLPHPGLKSFQRSKKTHTWWFS